MITLAYSFSGLSLLMSVLFLIKRKSPLGWIACLPKQAAGALSLFLAILGIVGAIIGWAYQGSWAILMGVVSAGMMIWYVWRCVRNHNGFANAFATDWSDLIKRKQAKLMVQKRRIWF